jgi:hypothetical protein
LLGWRIHNFVLEDELSVRRALDAYAKGLDFADAMHWASAADTPLHTFDGKFAKRISKHGRKVRLIKARDGRSRLAGAGLSALPKLCR